MPHKVILCLIGFLWTAFLAGVVTEDSASANALSGVTLLSTSLSDLALSPAIPAAGIGFSCHLPFGIPSAAVYSLNTASSVGPFLVNSGGAFLEHSDYRRQNFHLGLAWHYESISVGGAGHLLYEKFGDLASYHSWNGNLALCIRGEDYGTEIRWLHAGSRDSELHLSTSTYLGDGIACAADYVYVPHGDDNYRCATTCDIGGIFQLLASWQNTPARFGAGLKFNCGAIEILYAIRTHPDLNLSHSLDLGLRW